MTLFWNKLVDYMINLGKRLVGENFLLLKVNKGYCNRVC